MKYVFLILFVSLTAVVYSTSFHGFKYGGSQLVLTTLSYANNIRSSPSGKIWFRADKSMPNAFYATVNGDDPFNFEVTFDPPFPHTALPYLTFEVVNFENRDYLFGSAVGSMANNSFGLGLQVLTDSKVNYQIPSNRYCFYYAFTLDSGSINPDNKNLYFYTVGYCYPDQKINPQNLASVVSRGFVQLANDFPITMNEGDINAFDTCYDVWTEIQTFKPQLSLYKEDQMQYLLISIPGRCSRISKCTVPSTEDSFTKSECKVEWTIRPETGNDLDGFSIFSTAFSPETNQLFFTAKKYNTDISKLYSVDTKTMKITKSINLTVSESTPILAYDGKNKFLYLATSGFNQIIKYNTNLQHQGIAVLPFLLKAVSSMSVIGDYIYLTTNVPNVVVGRISTKNFCPEFCSDFGYCNEGKCACVDFYSQDMLSPTFKCSPTKIVNTQSEYISAKGTVAAFAVLFSFAVIAAITGWFLWFKRQSYQSLT